MTTVWALLDDRPGHAHQARGLAAALDASYEAKPLTYTPLSRLPNRLLGASIAHLSAAARKAITAPWPDMVIACGRRTEPVARYIKRNSPTTKLVYIMTPASPAGWDALVIPQHDMLDAGDPRIITTLGPLSAITQRTLTEALTKEAARERYVHLPRPRVGVLLGGAPKGGAFDDEGAMQMLAQAEQLAGGGALLITSSRRTPKDFRHKAEPQLRRPHDWYDGAQGADNPYLSILALADMLVVSGDSLSMCTEACSTGRPVFIHAPKHLPPKHRMLHAALVVRGSAQMLGDTAAPSGTSMPLDETARVAAELRTRFL